MDPLIEKQLNQSIAERNQLIPQLKELLDPALNTIGLDYFWYNRFINGPRYLSVGTQIISKSIYSDFSSQDLFFRKDDLLVQKQSLVIWDLEETSSMTSAMEGNGVLNGASVFRRRANYLEGWHLGSFKKNPNLYSLYLNHISAIHRLIEYFQQKVLPKLPLKKVDLFTPYTDGYVLTLPPLHSAQGKAISPAFYDATRLKKFTLYYHEKEVRLSLREIQCLCLLARGQSIKEIGQNLGLSPRTIEHYLDSVRNKTGCTDRSELCSLYRKTGIGTWLDEEYQILVDYPESSLKVI